MKSQKALTKRRTWRCRIYILSLFVYFFEDYNKKFAYFILITASNKKKTTMKYRKSKLKIAKCRHDDTGIRVVVEHQSGRLINRFRKVRKAKMAKTSLV